MDILAIILAILSITLIILNHFTYRLGKKKGANEFLDAILSGASELRIEQFKIQNKYASKNGIVFLGDSITQEYNVYEFYPGLQVYNRGIGGDTTVGLLKRLDVSVFDLKPKVVILLIGTNDLALLQTQITDIYERITNIIQTIQSQLKDTQIILQSIYPVIEPAKMSKSDQRTNENISALNKLISGIKDVVYIDMHKHLLKDGKLNAKYTRDGLHMNDTGYEVITNILKPYLKG